LLLQTGYNISQYAEMMNFDRSNFSSDLQKETLSAYKIRKYCKGFKVNLSEVFGIPEVEPAKPKRLANDENQELVANYIELTNKYSFLVSENQALYKTVLKLQAKLHENKIKIDD
jgi:hypothetical protein